jgi:soluble lytic murein transglycosylase-like protein
MKRFPTSGRFRNTEERLALLYMGAAKYAEAREAWNAWAAKSSRAARSSEVQFNAAYAAYRARDYATAEAELEELAAGRSKVSEEARYYLGKIQERNEEWQASRATWNELLDDEPDGWFSQVIRNRRRRARKEPDPSSGRNGLWPGPSPEAPLSVSAGTEVTQAVPALWRRPGFALPIGASDRPARAADGTPLPAAQLTALASAPPGPSRTELLQRLQAEHIPPTWEESARWDRASAWGVWKSFAKDHGEAWPELPVAYELSRVGLGEIAGPMVSEVHKQIVEYRRSRSARRDAARHTSSGGSSKDPEIERKVQAQKIVLKSRDWMAIFAGAGYPANVSAFAVDSIPFRSMGREDPDARRAWTLAYPAAFAPQVWRAAWESGVDPLLMLSIMRAESLYRHDAISPVGALGLVQVMPATGAKVAALGAFEDFRVERLLEPAVNIEVGTWYMGKLLQRFGPGQFPLAVGSYNGGPHNIGRWLKAKVGADLEDFVEEIAFDETRNYVKKVTRFYAVYADLYGGGAEVLLPPRTVEDDPSVINF